jgi:hypothetical protein
VLIAASANTGFIQQIEPFGGKVLKSVQFKSKAKNPIDFGDFRLTGK